MKEIIVTEKRPKNHFKFKLWKIKVDDADYNWLKEYDWTIRDGRACTKIGRSYVGMHRLIMGVTTGDPTLVDHEDNDPTNNQRYNLRLADRFKNQQNRKTNKGNTLPKGIRLLPSNKYNVRVQAYNKRINGGTFDTLEEAIDERNRIAKHLHGEFFNASHPINNE
jgi:hypothetical protein